MNPEIEHYNELKETEDKLICDALAMQISSVLPEAENKIWHAHPVWFLDGNPIVGYSKQKHFVRLMFWSGQSFDEDRLNLKGKKFKDASIGYTSLSELNKEDLSRWLTKAKEIQWDYKNIVKRKGVLERIK
ncbi:hypothetical protein C4F49_16600 [Sphingobacterium sp. KB22]|uniref:YdhG-like domain-containing protein n=1 Tax=Sphingobacterium hungaricum TaxID=2082723 RepID=A0A928UZ25_9SPHI|nr:hypothetical protein [Sphingobacterium hungaricum]